MKGEITERADYFFPVTNIWQLASLQGLSKFMISFPKTKTKHISGSFRKQDDKNKQITLRGASEFVIPLNFQKTLITEILYYDFITDTASSLFNNASTAGNRLVQRLVDVSSDDDFKGFINSSISTHIKRKSQIMTRQWNIICWICSFTYRQY